MIASQFASTLKHAANVSARSFSNTTSASAKVAVLGAAGGIGQPLSMLCKLSPEIDELSCYDVVGTPGVAADLSHVSEFNRFITFVIHHCNLESSEEKDMICFV